MQLSNLILKYLPVGFVQTSEDLLLETIKADTPKAAKILVSCNNALNYLLTKNMTKSVKADQLQEDLLGFLSRLEYEKVIVEMSGLSKLTQSAWSLNDVVDLLVINCAGQSPSSLLLNSLLNSDGRLSLMQKEWELFCENQYEKGLEVVC